MYLGLWYGAVGGVAATLAMGFSLMALDAPMDRLAQLYGQEIHILGFDATFALVTVAAGALSGSQERSLQAFGASESSMSSELPV
jgi:cell division protein FtsX